MSEDGRAAVLGFRFAFAAACLTAAAAMRVELSRRTLADRQAASAAVADRDAAAARVAASEVALAQETATR